MQLTIPAIIGATALAVSAELGVNCRGSFACGPKMEILQQLTNLLNGHINDQDRFYNGAHIGCISEGDWSADGYCAFLQSVPNGASGAEVKSHMQGLLDHGCKGCGSIPLGPNNDTNADGILTVNYVSNANCILPCLRENKN